MLEDLLEKAVRHGNAKLVEALIPVANCWAFDSGALKSAEKHGWADIIKLMKKAIANV